MKTLIAFLAAAAAVAAQTGADQITTMQGGTGAVVRQQSAKNNDIVNVADYGAASANADNAAYFADAIAHAPAGEIDLPGGQTYALKSGINLTDGQILDCHGSSLKAAANGITVVSFGALSHIHVRHCVITKAAGITGIIGAAIVTDANFRTFDTLEDSTIIGVSDADHMATGISFYDGTGVGNYFHVIRNVDIRYVDTGVLSNANAFPDNPGTITFDSLTVRNCGIAVDLKLAGSDNFTNLSMEGCTSGLVIENNFNFYNFVSGYRGEAMTSNKVIDIQGPNVANTYITGASVDNPLLINDQGTGTQIVTPHYTNTQQMVGLNVWDDSYLYTPLTPTNGKTQVQIVAGQNQGSTDLLHVCPYAFGASLACGSPWVWVDSSGVLRASGTITAPLLQAGNNLEVDGQTFVLFKYQGLATQESVIKTNAGFSGNFNGVWIAANNTLAETQANTTYPSWGIDLGGFDNFNHAGSFDKFGIWRRAAGGSTWALMFQVDTTGITFPDGTHQSTAATGGTTGYSGTANLTKAAGGSCALTISNGLITASTC